MMRVEDIIAAEAEKTGDDANQMIQVVSQLVDSQEGILLRKNDSVMLVVRIGGDDVEMNLFTADSPDVLPESLKYFIDKIKASDLKRVYGTIEFNAPILNMLRDFGIDVQKSDLPKYQWMANV